jgi:hypothetical protein
LTIEPASASPVFLPFSPVCRGSYRSLKSKRDIAYVIAADGDRIRDQAL